MNERPQIPVRIAGRTHPVLTAAEADALAAHRRATIVKRLGGRPSVSLGGRAFKARQAARLRHLRDILAGRG